MQLSAERMLEIARATLDGLPDPFAALAGPVAVQVAEWPPADVLRDLGLGNPLDLTGLYDGVPVTLKSTFDQPVRGDVIWLYRQPILSEMRARGEDPVHLVRHIVVHEAAHHFGWSDADIAAIDRWWE